MQLSIFQGFSSHLNSHGYQLAFFFFIMPDMASMPIVCYFINLTLQRPVCVDLNASIPCESICQWQILFILYLKFSPSQHPECVNPSASSVSMAILLFFKSHPGGVPLANCNTFASHLQDLVCIDILNLPYYTELCSSAFIVSHQYGAHQTFCVKVLSVFSFVFMLRIYMSTIPTHDFCR